MDIFDYRASKKVNTNGVFEPYKEEEGDLSGLFTMLKNLTISETNTKWDVAYLETYVKLNMVPRSLRWEVSPQKGDIQLEDWYKYFNEAGVSLLRFLIERKLVKLSRLDEEIKTLKEKLTPLQDTVEYKDKSQVLLNILEKEDREQKYKKKKKYNRNLADYHGGVVFEWQKKLLAANANDTKRGSYQSPHRTYNQDRGGSIQNYHPGPSHRPPKSNQGNRGGRNHNIPYYGPNQNQGRTPYPLDTSYHGSGYNQGGGPPVRGQNYPKTGGPRGPPPARDSLPHSNNSGYYYPYFPTDNYQNSSGMTGTENCFGFGGNMQNRFFSPTRPGWSTSGVW